MKKFLIMLLSAAIMSVPGCKKEGDTKNDLKTLKLQGKIKSIRSITYTAKEESGKIVKKERLPVLRTDSYTVFNEKGNISEMVYYDPNEVLSDRYLKKFDEKGNKIEETWFQRESAPEVRSTYKYDEKGNMIEETGFRKGSDKCNYRFAYRYDDKGNKIESISYDSCESEKISSRTVMKYDERGNMIEELCTGADGKTEWIVMYKYDAANNIIESLYGKDRESISSKKTFKYDDKGNCTEQVQDYTDGTYHLKEIFQYEYDSKGNWIKQITINEYSTGKFPQAIVEREIKYFE